MPILEDHYKVKKKLVTPFNHSMNIQEVSWTSETLPDILWAGLLIRGLRLNKGAEVFSDTIKTLNDFSEEYSKLDLELISTYENRTIDKRAIDTLKEKGLYKDLEFSLLDFFALYPDCPLINAFKFDLNKVKVTEDFIPILKELLAVLLDKNSKESTLTMANVIYSRMIRGRLIIHKDDLLYRINEVNDYPDTDISRQIASALRCTISITGSIDQSKQSKWIKYFWNNSYQLEPIKL